MSAPTTPTILYNYCPCNHAIDILTKLQIKITPPADFNDPFEVNPTFPRVEDLNSPSGLANPSPQELLFLETLPSSIRKVASEVIAAFCVSVANDDPLLWAHYADSHRGIAIGFNAKILEDHFTSMEGTEIKFHPVNYSRSRIAIAPCVARDIDLRKETFLQMCVTKSDAWIYENEFRLIIGLNKHIPKIINGKPIFLVPIPVEAIEEVILGVNFPDLMTRNIRFILRQKHFATRVRALQAKLNQNEYKIDFTHFSPFL